MSQNHNQYAKIPARIKQALDSYATDRAATGGFLRAVLENDLMRAMSRADLESRAALHDICVYVYNELPSGCWGDPETVRRWLHPEPDCVAPQESPCLSKSS
jgi:hypothetical protein